MLKYYDFIGGEGFVKTLSYNETFHSYCILMLLQGEAVQMIHQGRAPRITQPEEGATYDPLLKKANVKVV